MSHLLDPAVLANEEAYSRALEELETLMLADPDTPAGRRFDELAALIDDYEARLLREPPPRVPSYALRAQES